MRSGPRLFLLWCFISPLAWAQVPAQSAPCNEGDKVPEGCTVTTFQGAGPAKEALIRREIEIVQPKIVPLRVIFLPHWKYLYTAKMFQLHVPTGMSSLMFTHLASRSVFIDEDRVTSDEGLVYWMAHELGHLASNSTREVDAEIAAAPYRARLKATGNGKPLSATARSSSETHP